MNITYPRVGVGIDPGWKNLGLAIILEAEPGVSKILLSKVIDPSALLTPWSIGRVIFKDIYEVLRYNNLNLGHVASVGMERYVAYAGVDTSNAENILMIIGSILGYSEEVLSFNLYKAIDWKKDLSKHLFKEYGFRNPSTSFDKKFSIAAAKACVMNYDSYPVKTNHEADAIGIAYRALLEGHARRL